MIKDYKKIKEHQDLSNIARIKGQLGKYNEAIKINIQVLGKKFM